MKTADLLHKIGLDSLLSTMLAISHCIPSLFWIKMDLDEAPRSVCYFHDQRSFGVNQDTDSLELDFIVNMTGGGGILQVANGDDGEILWQSDVKERAVFTQAVGPLKKGQEYIVRFTGSVFEHAAITVSSRSEHVQELIHSSAANELAPSA